MAKSKKLVTLIREMVRQEVKKEVKKIFISEGAKAMSQNINDIPDVLPKPVPKKSNHEEVSYTKDPTLNKILNETANAGNNEFDEYPTMTGKPFDTSRMAEAIGYGNVTGDAEMRRKASAVQTAQAAGVDPNSPAVQDVMSNLTKDYRGVMNALKKKDNK
tara:strand:- start:399 stop:878 length:480 start_codon:yes stop_codon:yes gene_type:complete